MKLELKRIAKKDTYTIGKLYIDGIYFSDTLEDRDRNLRQDMSIEEIKQKKIYGQTAIPTGTYKIDMNTVSPKFGSKSFYKKTCNGKVPRLMNVPGFDGILIHVGDGPKAEDLTYGCILVGKNKYVGQLNDGKQIFTELCKRLKGQKDIILTIE